MPVGQNHGQLSSSVNMDFVSASSPTLLAGMKRQDGMMMVVRNKERKVENQDSDPPSVRSETILLRICTQYLLLFPEPPLPFSIAP